MLGCTRVRGFRISYKIMNDMEWHIEALFLTSSDRAFFSLKE